MRSHVGPSISLSAIVVRACDECGHGRAVGKPCEGCGNRRPPKVTDLGVIASKQQNRWKRLKWKLWGVYAAQRRIRKTNRDMLGGV